ncbi:MAG: hypothetical protein H8E62_06035 [Planctomycetes bacterium]|nr:hypothetical protein [Planctomycetota bacterium]
MLLNALFLKGQRFWAGILFFTGLLLLILSYVYYSHTLLYAVAIPVMNLSTFWFLRYVESLRKKRIHYTLAAFLSGIYSLIFLVVITLSFFTLPKGTEILPMGYGLAMLLVSIISGVSGLILTVLGQITNGRWFFNLSALACCLSVYWIADLVFRYAISVRELVLSP